MALLEKRRFLYNHSGDFPQVILILSQSRAEHSSLPRQSQPSCLGPSDSWLFLHGQVEGKTMKITVFEFFHKGFLLTSVSQINLVLVFQDRDLW